MVCYIHWPFAHYYAWNWNRVEMQLYIVAHPSWHDACTLWPGLISHRTGRDIIHSRNECELCKRLEGNGADEHTVREMSDVWMFPIGAFDMQTSERRQTRTEIYNLEIFEAKLSPAFDVRHLEWGVGQCDCSKYRTIDLKIYMDFHE